MTFEGTAIKQQFNASYAHLIYKASSLSSLIFGADRLKTPIFLSVQGGNHNESSLTLYDNCISIGGSLEDDVLLTDSEIGELSVELDFKRTFWGTVSQISTDRDDILINGSALSSGNHQVKLPAILTIKSIDIYIDNGAEHSTSAFTVKETFLFSILILLGFLFAWGSGHFPSAKVNQFGWEAVVPATINAEVQNQSPNDAVTKNISDLNLDQYLSINSEEAGQIKVTGSIPSSRSVDWQEALAFIDALPESSQIIIDVTRKPNLQNVPPVSIVKLHGEKQLILQSGDVISLNQILVDDWILVDLTIDGMTLSRLDEVIDVQF